MEGFINIQLYNNIYLYRHTVNKHKEIAYNIITRVYDIMRTGGQGFGRKLMPVGDRAD